VDTRYKYEGVANDLKLLMKLQISTSGVFASF